MPFDSIEGGLDTTGLSTADRATRAARDDKARRNLAGFAFDKPPAEREAWLCDILDALGLRGKTRPAKSAHSLARDVQRPGRLVHGTTTGYSRFGCRCELCREANSVYLVRYRAKRKAEAES